MPKAHQNGTVKPPDALEPWLRAWARDLGRPTSGPLSARRTASGAELWLLDDLAIKLHAARTDAAALSQRLRVASMTEPFLPPVAARTRAAPDGRAATVWPLVGVADPDDDIQPWAAAGKLLAGLHRTQIGSEPELPRHGWPARLVRATRGAPDELRALGTALAEQAQRPEPASALVHGDWHLGQLGRRNGGWRLLDIDDLGVGDPAWDLARPAGFWACGLLAGTDWRAFLDAYRAAGGPAVPASGDPWPRLDLPARAAVFVAAVRAAGTDDVHSAGTAQALLEACRRMAQ